MAPRFHWQRCDVNRSGHAAPERTHRRPRKRHRHAAIARSIGHEPILCSVSAPIARLKPAPAQRCRRSGVRSGSTPNSG